MPHSLNSRLARRAPVQTIQAHEFPVLRLTFEDIDGRIQRMTLRSTCSLSTALDTPDSAEHLSALARRANLELLEVHHLTTLHLEMRSHPVQPSETRPGAFDEFL